MIEKLYLHMYSRQPLAVESKLAQEFIANAGDAKLLAVQELMRTLMCSAEYRFVR
jgi:hypothetical protein